MCVSTMQKPFLLALPFERVNRVAFENANGAVFHFTQFVLIKIKII